MKRASKWSAAGLYLGVPAIVVLILVLGLSGGLRSPRRISRNVQVGNVSLQGATRAEAAERLRALTPARAGWSLSFTCDGRSWQPRPEEIGVTIDVDGTLSDVWRAGQVNPFSHLTAHLLRNEKTVTVPPRLTLAEPVLRSWLTGIVSAIDVAPVNAHFAPRSGEITPEIPGRRLEVDATVAQARTAVAHPGKQSIALVTTALAPTRSAAELATVGSAEISRFVTYYNADLVPRSTNIALAVGHLDGAVVRPGETFSFNGTVGPRTAEGGYQEALEIVRGEYVPGIGGGVCQVSSTLYNAALLAGMGIVERTPHSRIPVYVAAGRDATVAYGNLDLKFRNDRSTPIVIVAYADAGQLTIAIRGRATPGESCAVETSTIATIPAESRQEVDPALAPGELKEVKPAIDGLEVEVWRVINGRRQRLSHDIYPPVPGLFRVGPEVDPTSPSPPANGQSTLGDITPKPVRPAIIRKAILSALLSLA